MTHETLLRGELAERWGVTERTITNRQQAGMPSRTRSGRVVFSWPECRDWQEEQVRQDGRATRHAGGDEDLKQRMADARLRTAMAEAEEAELNVAARRGELVPVAFMASEFERIAQALRTRLLSLPQSWAPRLDPCLTTVDRQIALQDAVNELMPLLRELVDDDGTEEKEARPAAATA